jgi:hypothetical protein
MKKIIFILMMLFTTTLFAQEKFTEFKAGLLMPTDAKTGFFGGLTMGRAIDENVGISLAIDVYRKSYIKDEAIFDTTIVTGQKDIRRKFEQSATLIPIFFQFHYQGEITPLFNLRVTAGLGYEFLWTNYTDYEHKTEDSFFFSGFGWHVDAGVWYPLSRASDIYAELLYHSGIPSKDKKDKEGFPIRTEVDMSGLGFRIGLRIYNFGF